MRTLILHTNTFQTEILSPSNRPEKIIPEKKTRDTEKMNECIVVFFCVEKTDTKDTVQKLFEEVVIAAREVGTQHIMLAPFVHLSKNIASSEVAKKYIQLLYNRCKETRYTIQSSHFGFHKRLLLDIKGHPGSFRYREFY